LSLVYLGYSSKVPGNATRYFESAEHARQQPTGSVNVALASGDPYLFNIEFNPELIRHDDSYCTSVVNLDGSDSVPTVQYFLTQVAPHLSIHPRIVEIGCGQGEFVRYLSLLSMDAVGFDPVLRNEASNLFQRYWTTEEEPAELYIMRCVLPHIQNPWAFLEQIRTVSPNSLVLVEFQSTEWLIEHSIWYMLSHDHVNYLFIEDFSSRYNVRGQGTFKKGEWAWVLIDFTEPVHPPPIHPKRIDQLAKQMKCLALDRDNFLGWAKELARPIGVWGSAGKGTVLCSALKQSLPEDQDIIAVDADSNRWGKYLESSGIQVVSPDSVRNLPRDYLILVANPNHFEEVGALIDNSLAIALPSSFKV